MGGAIRSPAMLALLMGASGCQSWSDDETSRSTERSANPRSAAPTSPRPEPPTSGKKMGPAPTPTSMRTGLEPRHVDVDLRKRPVPEQQAYLLSLLAERHDWGAEPIRRVREMFAQAPRLGFGNPKISEPAMSQAECFERWGNQAPHPADRACGFPNMVRLRDESGSARGVCIDQFEFPNLVCEYPVVWVRASEAALLCDVQGKRLCDAHEWEGACAGSVGAPDDEYLFSRLPKGIGPEYRRNRRLLMEDWHNRPRQVVWAYGTEKVPGVCGMSSGKSPTCSEASFVLCGTNDFPAGAFPQCVSPIGVYDQHGNVAEHMSFPLFPEELGGQGWTEMKGSWFIAAETHPDDCRWRAKNWHTTKISDPNSHNNYHLGFRCCSDE